MSGNPDPALLGFLRNPDSYPHRPKRVSEIHTHASLVFVAEPWVYKIKKSVDFGFLDFSTLEKRRHFCMREVELNSRLAPGIYLGIETITRSDRGFAFGGSGQTAEYAVKMRYLNPDGFLSAMIDAGTAGVAEVERAALTLAGFYRSQSTTQDIATWGTIEKLRLSTDENFTQSRDFIGHTISPQAFEAIRTFTSHCYHHRQRDFNQRIVDGWIRDCHGDLHLDHIHIGDDALQIYDCIEFSDRLRHIDVANDIAFLSMDLDYHGRPDLTGYFALRMAQLLEDPALLRMLDFYQCYRAYVRGKVESLKAAEEQGEERVATERCAQRYFRLALQYATGGRKAVTWVFMGRPASGKSSLSQAAAQELGIARLSSDECRKQLAGLPMLERPELEVRKALYSPAMTTRTYEYLIHHARERMQQGQRVILDATFSDRTWRDRLRQAIGDERVRWIILSANETTTRQRMLQRDAQPNTSDARAEDLPLLNEHYEPPDELPPMHTIQLESSGNMENCLSRLWLISAERQAQEVHTPESAGSLRPTPTALPSVDPW